MHPNRTKWSRPTPWVVLATFCLSSAGPALAQPVSPERGGPLPDVVRDVLRRDPTAYEFSHAWFDHTERAKQNRALLELGLLKGSPEELAKATAVSGVRRVPVFLAKYSDTGADPIATGDLQKELFDGPWPTGTMTEYYDEISYGMLQLDGKVFDWVTVANDDDYYAGNVNGLDPANSRVGEFIHEIVDAWDGTVDFGDYDNDGPDGIPNSGDDDGFVDFIGIVHPEIGGECAGTPANNIWAHRWRLSGWDAGTYTTNDARAGGGNIRIEDYTIMPALGCGGAMIEIGVFCHEFGHAFGLPDLYDTDSDVQGDSEGIGWWGLMGAGNWNSPESPAHMSAWSKAELGWINPATVASDLYNWPISSSTLTPTAFKLWKNGTPGSEYFLVEYRTADGFDADIESEGLLVWHVDDSISNNKDERKKMLDLECADQTGADHTVNADHLDRLTNRGDAGDVFCDGKTFEATTTPSSVAHNGTATDVKVLNIKGCGSGRELVADLIVGQPEGGVNLCMRDCGADACNEPSTCTKFWASPEIYIDNNSDGIIDPPADGIANRLFARVRNFGGDAASNVNVGFYYADPALGLLFPSTGTLIDNANIPIIASSGSEAAMVEWTIPVPPATINHYCVGVIATNAQDGQSSERAPDDNNVAQINIQELFAKAGSSVPPQPALEVASDGSLGWDAAVAGRAPSADPPYQFDQFVQVCNVLRESGNCTMRIVVGSPPNYDDVIVKGDWTWTLSFEEIQLSFGKCETLEVKAINHDPVHLDRLELPLTLLCEQQPVGGTILTFNIDNVPPSPPCSFDLVRSSPPETDNAPGEDALRVRWRDDFFDQLGFPERVERWKLYVVPSPGGDPAVTGDLVIETCLDEDIATSEYDHFADVRPDEADVWYALEAIDRAGNRSQACFAQVETMVTDAPANVGMMRLDQNVPNPFNPRTRISFQLATSGAVSLHVFDAKGRAVRELLDGVRNAGLHHVVWDGTDDAGLRVASGQYFYRLQTEHDADQTRSMTLVK